MKITAKAIAAMTIAEPRSPCTRHSPLANAASARAGTRVRLGEAIWSRRWVSRCAIATSIASFRNSLGWKLTGPTDTHELASLTRSPMPGTNGSTIAPQQIANAG